MMAATGIPAYFVTDLRFQRDDYMIAMEI